MLKPVPQILITQFDNVEAVLGASQDVLVWCYAHTSDHIKIQLYFKMTD